MATDGNIGPSQESAEISPEARLTLAGHDVPMSTVSSRHPRSYFPVLTEYDQPLGIEPDDQFKQSTGRYLRIPTSMYKVEGETRVEVRDRVQFNLPGAIECHPYRLSMVRHKRSRT